MQFAVDKVKKKGNRIHPRIFKQRIQTALIMDDLLLNFAKQRKLNTYFTSETALFYHLLDVRKSDTGFNPKDPKKAHANYRSFKSKYRNEIMNHKPVSRAYIESLTNSYLLPMKSRNLDYNPRKSLPPYVHKLRENTIVTVEKMCNEEHLSYKHAITFLNEKQAFLHILRRQKRNSGFDPTNEKKAYGNYRVYKSRYWEQQNKDSDNNHNAA